MFLTWHRPYLALFEQQLQNNAISEAKKFNGSDQQKYLAAAQKLRLPYWDWASNVTGSGSIFPEFMTTEQITVTMPNGTQQVDNPLFQYVFPDGFPRLGVTGVSSIFSSCDPYGL